MTFKIGFDSIGWQQIRPDVRQKVYCEGARQLRLVEFGQCEGEEWWCEHGHIGYVLQGGLEISFDGNVLRFAEGELSACDFGDGLFCTAVEDWLAALFSFRDERPAARRACGFAGEFARF